MCGAAAFMVVAGLAGAKPAAADTTLEQALVAAYRNNPRLLAARAQLRAVDEQVPQALSNWRPTITGNASYGQTQTLSKGTISNVTARAGQGALSSKTDETRNPHSGGVTLTQPIFRGFRSFAELRGAENQVRAQRATLQSVEQQVLQSAATAFMDVVRDQAVLDLNVNNVQVLERQLQATRDRFQVGEVTQTDVSQAEARLARARADRVRAEGQLRNSQAAYQNVVGQLPGKLVQPPPISQLPKTYDSLLEQASQQNPTVVQAKYVEKAARDDVDDVEGELLPTLSFVGSVDRGDSTNRRGSVSQNNSVALELTVPLYQAGSTTSRVRAAKQVVGQRRMEIIAARRDAVEQATSAWQDLASSRAQVKAFQAAVKANRVALEGVREEAAAGLRTVLDVLDAEQELLDSEVSLVGAQRDEVVASFSIRAAAGTLTAQDLSLNTEIYDPKRHYQDVRMKLWGLGESLPEAEN